MIDVELLALCETATATNNRLSILNTFDTIREKFFPFDFGCHLAGKITFSPDEPSHHSVHIRLTSKNNEYLIGFGLQDVVLNPPENIEFSRSFNFVAVLTGLHFKQPGLHYIDLYVNSKLAKRIQIYTDLEI